MLHLHDPLPGKCNPLPYGALLWGCLLTHEQLNSSAAFSIVSIKFTTETALVLTNLIFPFAPREPGVGTIPKSIRCILLKIWW